MEHLRDRLGFAIVPSTEAGETCNLVIIVDRRRACLVLPMPDRESAEKVVREILDSRCA